MWIAKFRRGQHQAWQQCTQVLRREHRRGDQRRHHHRRHGGAGADLLVIGTPGNQPSYQSSDAYEENHRQRQVQVRATQQHVAELATKDDYMAALGERQQKAGR